MSEAKALPLMYTDLAEWFHLLTRPEGYAEEAAVYARTIREAVPGARTMLELGSGGGNTASHLKRDFAMVLSDLSPQMLAVSRRLNPELEHIEGDMRSLRLGREFDAVFLHDAVMYMTSEDDLRRAIGTAHAHVRPGGVVLIVPDFTRETFHEGAHTGGHDGEDVTPAQPGRALRYLEWVYDPDPRDTRFLVDFAYLLREPGSAALKGFIERHELGLFRRETWLQLLQDAGFEARALPFEHSKAETVTEMFLGVKGQG
jgi:SAM-dependent methyltransferase